MRMPSLLDRFFLRCYNFSDPCGSLREGGPVVDAFLIAVNTVTPLFLMMLVGVIARATHIITPETASRANAMCFRLLISTLMFYNMYTVEDVSAFHGPLIAYCAIGVILEFLLGLPLVLRLEKANPVRGVLLQSFFRTNIALFALPMGLSLFGADNIGMMSVVVAVMVPLINILAVIDLELFRGGKPDLRKILRGIVTNPLVIGAVLGIVFFAADLRLPSAVESAVKSLAGSATPISLVLLGVSLDFKKFAAAARSLAISTVMRLVVNPAIFIGLAIALGFRGTPLGCIMLLFAPPVSVSSYTMAAEMGGDGDLAAEIVVLTTACSCVTMFLWIWLLKSLGLF